LTQREVEYLQEYIHGGYQEFCKDEELSGDFVHLQKRQAYALHSQDLQKTHQNVAMSITALKSRLRVLPTRGEY
tara:strand:- start:936 stop:1157 length:222 start_codon:yes stop_codon:yes gene_type:complete